MVHLLLIHLFNYPDSTYLVACGTCTLIVSELVKADVQQALLGVYTVRSSNRPVGPTQATSDCLSDQSDRPVEQTVADYNTAYAAA